MAKKNMRVTMDETRESLNIINDPRRSFGGSTLESFIFLVLDCYSYTAGEKVTGEILLMIAEPLDKACLKIQSKGQEKVTVYSSKDRSQILLDETRDVFILDTKVENWEPGLPTGHYVFPFNFKLPAYSPASFYYSGDDVVGNYVKAEVIYSLTIKLEINNSPGLSHMRIVHVKNIGSLEKPGPSLEATASISSCCFSNKGTTDFQLSVGNTDHCQVDGEVMYKLIPNNTLCKAPINQVVGTVLMEMEVHTKKGSFQIYRKLSEVDRATWISAFTSLIYERDFEYHSDLKVASDELNPCTNHSALIRCEYIVEVIVYYDIAFIREPIVIRLPFHVNPKINYRKEDPNLPFNWNPIESSIYNFIVETQIESTVFPLQIN